MKALVTGFEPFGDDPINPALEALHHLPRRLGNIEIATWILPTVFGRSLDALDNALTATRPDLVLCVGLAGGRAALSLERVAINLDDARIPDNDGRAADRPRDRAGRAAPRISRRCRSRRRCGAARGRASRDRVEHGGHLCLQPRFLRADAPRRDRSSGDCAAAFCTCRICRRRRRACRFRLGTPSMALADIVRGIEIVLAVAASRTEDVAAREGAIS